MNNLKKTIEESRDDLFNNVIKIYVKDVEDVNGKANEVIKSHEQEILKAVLESLQKSIPIEENGSERKATIPKYLIDFIDELNKLIND